MASHGPALCRSSVLQYQDETSHHDCELAVSAIRSRTRSRSDPRVALKQPHRAPRPSTRGARGVTW